MLYKLGDLNPNYKGLGKADSRLTETSLYRGCGGVGILWKKSFDVTPISGMQSDRICGVKVRKTTGGDEAIFAWCVPSLS